MLARRKFLATTACTVIAARLHAQGQSKVRVALTIPKEATGPRMPVDFVGLSYEVQQLADPAFFSGQNSGLIREFKALCSTGVLRLGATPVSSLTGNLRPIRPNQSILKSVRS
ncbi:MAG TPA: hypothetical protein VHM93_21940 [Candidatus Acidoferrum sp.]|jgi:hypothetical protein|nr:hypothetical protein [Candidatus Acidoferrum sp.]